MADTSNSAPPASLATLRALLLEEPSAHTWQRLCLLLESFDPSEQATAIEYAQAHLEPWPAALRRPRYAWWEARQQGKPSPFGVLVRDRAMWIVDAGNTPGEARRLPNLPDATVVWVPPGTFVMGNPDEEEEEPLPGETQEELMARWEREGPATNVTISRGFWMWQTPVSVAQWRALIGMSPTRGRPPNYPVDQISWMESVMFCQMLSSHLQLPGAYTLEDIQGIPGESTEDDYFSCDVTWEGPGTPGFRLPTEAEWEYAARAGLESTCYGNPNEIGWSADNCGHNDSNHTPHALRQKKPSPWGLYDIYGNVWEWCWDWWQNHHPGGHLIDPTGPVDHDEYNRITRGCSCRISAGLFHSYVRGGWPYHSPEPLHSFRPVLNPTVHPGDRT